MRQDLWLHILLRWPKYDSGISFEESFANVVIEHALVDRFRHAMAFRRRPKGAANVTRFSKADVDQPRRSPLTGQEQWELGEDLAAALARIPTAEAELLRRLVGTTISALARELGVPRSTLSDRVQRLRRRLKHILADYQHDAR